MGACGGGGWVVAACVGGWGEDAVTPPASSGEPVMSGTLPELRGMVLPQDRDDARAALAAALSTPPAPSKAVDE